MQPHTRTHMHISYSDPVQVQSAAEWMNTVMEGVPVTALLLSTDCNANWKNHFFSHSDAIIKRHYLSFSYWTWALLSVLHATFLNIFMTSPDKELILPVLQQFSSSQTQGKRAVDRFPKSVWAKVKKCV